MPPDRVGQFDCIIYSSIVCAIALIPYWLLETSRRQSRTKYAQQSSHSICFGNRDAPTIICNHRRIAERTSYRNSLNRQTLLKNRCLCQTIICRDTRDYNQSTTCNALVIRHRDGEATLSDLAIRIRNRTGSHAREQHQTPLRTRTGDNPA